MLAVVAIVGRPNVGKSTLFNVLTKTRNALAIDVPGVTRDRQYGKCTSGTRPFIVVDTGGVEAQGSDNSHQALSALAEKQSWTAVAESDLVLWVVDARAGITARDQELSQKLRKIKKPILLIVNKTEGLEMYAALADFHALALGNPLGISAAHGRGIEAMLACIEAQFVLLDKVPATSKEDVEDQAGIKIAIVGRPNVGKSTLVNRLMGEDRVLVFDEPGTTRDSIYLPLQRRGVHYTIIDTAGLRRRTKIKESV